MSDGGGLLGAGGRARLAAFHHFTFLSDVFESSVG